MMYLGENAVGIATANIGSAFKIKVIEASNEIYQNAEAAGQWLLSNVPASDIAIVIREHFVKTGRDTRGDGTLLMAIISNNTLSTWLRLYNGSTMFGTNWTTTYYLSVDANDKYLILYK